VRHRIFTLGKQTGLMLCSVRNTALAQWLSPLVGLGNPGSNPGCPYFFPFLKMFLLHFQETTQHLIIITRDFQLQITCLTHTCSCLSHTHMHVLVTHTYTKKRSSSRLRALASAMFLPILTHTHACTCLTHTLTHM
jgi:hypothetical protein